MHEFEVRFSAHHLCTNFPVLRLRCGQEVFQSPVSMLLSLMRWKINESQLSCLAHARCTTIRMNTVHCICHLLQVGPNIFWVLWWPLWTGSTVITEIYELCIVATLYTRDSLEMLPLLMWTLWQKLVEIIVFSAIEILCSLLVCMSLSIAPLWCRHIVWWTWCENMHLQTIQTSVH